MGKSRPIRRQSGRPSFGTLIAANDSLILAHFSHSDIGLGMGPKIGFPYLRLGFIKRTAQIPNNRSAIYGRSWGNRDQFATNPGDPLSGPKSRLWIHRFWLSSSISAQSQEISGDLTGKVARLPSVLNLGPPNQVRAPTGARLGV